MGEVTIRAIAHSELTPADVDRLRRLFDAEYLYTFGEWDPDMPYGYAPHDVHVVGLQGDTIVGHVGWARRAIGVGDSEVVVAGVGGVLISNRARGERLGTVLMSRAALSMEEARGVAFGYLGCREEVAPFYRSCGWTRISAVEHSLDRAGRVVSEQPGQPLFVLPVELQLGVWPEGEIDLRGRAW